MNALAPMHSVLSPAGRAADIIANLSWVMMIGAGVIFFGVMGLLAWAVSRRAGQRAVRTWVWVMGGGVLFPLVVLSSLFAWSDARKPGWLVPPPCSCVGAPPP